MKSMIDQAFRRYGMTVTVEHGAETGETHGFVQPVTAVSGGEPFSVVNTKNSIGGDEIVPVV